jgi:hypothetical protein
MANRGQEFETLRMAYRKAVTDIISRAAPGVNPEFHPANAAELRILKSLQLPDSIELFYEEFAPNEKLGVWGIDRDCVLLPIPGIEWYSNSYDGLTRNGYITFATTCDGNVYCFDLAAGGQSRDIPIYLLSHEVDYSQTSRDALAGKRKFVVESLLAFLMYF